MGAQKNDSATVESQPRVRFVALSLSAGFGRHSAVYVSGQPPDVRTFQGLRSCLEQIVRRRCGLPGTKANS
jgi:hypothetical protein